MSIFLNCISSRILGVLASLRDQIISVAEGSTFGEKQQPGDVPAMRKAESECNVLEIDMG